MKTKKQLTIYTIGHSTHPLPEMINILKQYKIEQLIDVRTIARSRTNPQFNSDTFAHALEKEGIAYLHLKELGGLRHAHKDSINTAWKNASFRGYADYMQTAEFDHGLKTLITQATDKTTAILCAEAVPWRCHRSMIADALILLHHIKVKDIFSATVAHEHKPVEWARVKNGTIYYPQQ